MKTKLMKTLGWVGLSAVMGASQMIAQDIATLVPNSAPAGSPGFLLTVNGSGLAQVSQLRWVFNNQTTFIPVLQSAQTTFNVNIAAPLLQTPGVAVLSACNTTPALTCGVSANFTITSAPTAPTITSTTPAIATAGDTAVTITLSGTGFEGDSSGFTGSRVVLTGPGGASPQVVPATISGTSITATIPLNPALTVAGPATIRVINVSDGTQSNAFAFTILPGPTISNLQLNPSPLGGTIALTVTGTNYIKGDKILIGSPGCLTISCLQAINTTFNNSIILTGSLPGSFIQTPGIYNVFVQTPGGALSNVSPLTIGLQINSLTPATVSQNVNPPPVLTVTASAGLSQGYQIVFNGVALPATVFDSPTQVHVQLTAQQVSQLGTVQVSLSNPSTGVTSNSLPFTVVPSLVPTITSYTPTLVNQGDTNIYLVLNGANYQQDGSSYTGSRVIFTPPGGGAAQTLTPGTNTGNVITLTIPNNLLTTPGSATIVVTNVSDGKTSNLVNLNILARPTITSLFLNPTAAGGTTALTVNGTNFNPGDVIYIGPPGCGALFCAQAINTTYNTSTLLTGSIPGSFIATPGIYSVFVKNLSGTLSLPAPLTVSLFITGINPGSVLLNSNPPVLTVTVVGGLVSGVSVISFNGVLLSTVVDSPTQAHATLSAANVGTVGMFPVTIQNSSATVSNPVPFVVFTPSTPTITSITPGSAFVGDGNTLVTITGTNFQQDSGNSYTGARVIFTPPGGVASSPIQPNSNTGTTLTFVISQAQLATAGNASIVVTNVTDNRSSAPSTFPIKVVNPLTPSISAITPGGVFVGDNDTVVVITGLNFQADAPSYTGARVNFTTPANVTQQLSNATISNNGTTLTTTFPKALFTIAGTASFTITNVSDNRTSNPFTFIIRAVPTITSLFLNPTPVGQTSALTVNGTNFASGDTILIGPPGCATIQCLTAINTTFNTSLVLTGSIPGSLIQTPGNYVVYVQTPFGRLVGPVSLTVSLTLTSITPNSAAQGSTPGVLTVQAVGGLIQGSTVIYFNGQPLQGTVVDSPTQAHVQLTAANLATLGVFPVTVQNGTFASNAISFTVFSGAAPAISSLTPGGTFVNSPDTVLTITGTGFNSDARVLFLPPGTTTSTSLSILSNNGTVIAATVPASLLTTVGSAQVVVNNVAANTSSIGFIFVIRALPVISQLNPNPTGAGLTVALTVQGSNFASGDTVMIGSQGCTSIGCLTALNTTFNSASNLAASLPGTLIPNPGIYNVYIRTSFGALSLMSPLTVTLGLISVSPASAVQNTGPVTLTVTSTGGFAPGATVFLAGQVLQTTFVSQTQVTAVTDVLPVAGTFQLYVQNVGSTPSNSLAFTVTSQGQFLSMSPNTAFAGTGPITITLMGSTFQPTDTVRFGTTSLVTTFVNSTTITAIITPSLILNAGNFPVTVQTQQGLISNALNFRVTLQITGLTPTFFNAGGSTAQSLTATLTGGVTANTVLFYGGVQVQTVSFTATSITASIPANLTATAGTPAVYVVDGGNQSNTVNHLIVGTLTLSSISPTFANAGAATTSITLTGVGFDSGSFATVNGTQIPTTFVSSTSLTAQIQATSLATVGTLQIGVTDSHNRTSNQLPFAVLTPLTITSLNPASTQIGSTLTLTVNGTGFDTGSVVKWTAGSFTTSLSTAFISATQLTAILPASLTATAGNYCISVMDSRGRTTPCATFTVQNSLIITSLNPSSAGVGTGFDLAIVGPAFPFNSTITVFFGTTQLVGSLLDISTPTIGVTIPAGANQTVGVVPVRVQIGSQVSNTLPFTVTGPTTSTAPVIYNVSPSQLQAPTTATVATITGINFVSGSIVLVNGSSVSTTFINSTTLTAILPAFSNGASPSIQVVNPNNQVSNIFYIQVSGTNRVSVKLYSITPNSALQNSPGFTLTAVGDNFQAGAVITFGSTQLTTQYVSSTQVTGAVPASLLTVPGGFPVWVTNPDGTASPALLFTVINLKPVITSLMPPSISAGAPQFNLTINGMGFKTGATVTFAGAAVTANFVSATQMTATIPAALVAKPGNVPVVVTNPDGNASDPFTFVINPFSLTSISPTSANVGDQGFTMTLTGVGFLNGAQATFNGATVSTVFVSSTSLTASIPGSGLQMPGTVNVTVINPDSAVAGPLPFLIKGIVLTSISPISATANTKSVTISASGTGFVQGSTLNFNGATISTRFISPTSLSGTIPGSALMVTGAFPVSVSNPNGDTSNSLTFTVLDPLALPTITSVAPATAPIGSPALPIVVAGTNFVSGSVIAFGGNNIATTFVSATELRGTVPATQLTQAGTFTIAVINPDGNSSNTINFIVATPLSITSLSPTALQAGGGDSTLVVIGSGIVAGATVQFGGTTLSPDSTSPTQISVTIPAKLLATSGVFNVTVTNPDGKVSNGLPVTVVGIPTITINATVSAGTTNQITLTLADPAPADLTGTLVMSFVSNTTNAAANYVDPAQQFAAGGTSVAFTIAKGAKIAVIPQNGSFSPGTVAGTLTFTLTKLLSGIDNVLSNPPPSKSFTIDRAVPVLTPNTVKIINGTSGGFTVEVIGFTTTREMVRANITFVTNSSVSIDGGGSVSIDVTTAFNNYFNSAAGQLNGGNFKLDVPFSITGADASVITAVSVSLTNTAGSSPAVSGGR